MRRGFTLVELLITIMIIGILVTIATFGVRQAQQSARDGRRRSDLENLAVALELYRSDCNAYPTSLGTSLQGNGSTTRCANSNVYMDVVPADPQGPTRRYAYSGLGPSFVLCASLEQAPNPAVSTAGCGSCGSGFTCNWRVSRP